jgi:SgrR family transcriptional regulator
MEGDQRMKIRRHYLTLRQAFPAVTEHMPFDSTTQELAALLQCTQRNMVLLLGRMQQEQWLAWTPKRGRGNRSQLVFLAPAEQLALQEAQELVQKQHLQAALALVGQMDESLRLREQLQTWLTGQFGFQSNLEGKRRTDILRFPLPQTIYSLDPAAIHYTGESHLVNQLFDGLVRIDPQGGHILPHLAHAWDVDETRTCWTFYLRKGILFHHGRELDSSDVKYSLERLRALAPQGLYSWVYTAITSMETPDDTTIRIRLHERNELFLPFLASNRASIVPQDACEAAGERFGARPVGTGPFRLADHQQDVWILEAFPSYFQGRAFLDRVEVWTLAKKEGLLQQEEQPSFQIMHNARLSGNAAERWQQIRQSGTTCKFITVNERRGGLLANSAIRQAIDHVISRTELLRLLAGDVTQQTNSFWPEEEAAPHTEPIIGHNDDGAATEREPHAYLGKVKEQLRQAGYAGEKLTLATIPQYVDDADRIRQLCARAGVPLQINLITAEQFKGEARMDADLLLFAIMLDEHRELRLIDLYRSMQQHASEPVRSWLEAGINRLLTEPELQRRANIFRQLEAGLTERSSLLFLYRKQLKTAYHPSVRGISLESLGWVRFKDIWFT